MKKVISKDYIHCCTIFLIEFIIFRKENTVIEKVESVGLEYFTLKLGTAQTFCLKLEIFSFKI